MGYVFIDNDIYKVSLEIVGDFINNDYDSFIQNEPVEDIRIIKWVLKIQFKLLENKNESVKIFYMLDFKNKLKHTLKDNTTLRVNEYYIKYRWDNNAKNILIDNININIQCNIKECFIDIIFFCDELDIKKTYEQEIERGEFKPLQYNYLNQLHFIFKQKIKNIFSKTSTNYSKLSKLDDPSILIDPTIINTEDRQYLKTDYLKSIVKNHYNDILINFESYILYCKTEKINIDFKKISERMRYIKDYIKKFYDISIV